LAATVIEEIANGWTDTLFPFSVAEPATKFAGIGYQYGSIEGAAKRATNESGDRLGVHVDGLIHRGNFRNRNSTVEEI
jgi:hypothetical protein